MRLLRILRGQQIEAPKSRVLLFPFLYVLVRVYLSVVIVAGGILLILLIGFLLLTSVLPVLYVMYYFRLEITVGHVILRCS